jgi:hypothetical protein
MTTNGTVTNSNWEHKEHGTWTWCDTVLTGEQLLHVSKDHNAFIFWTKQSKIPSWTADYGDEGTTTLQNICHSTRALRTSYHRNCYLPSALELFPTVTHHSFCMLQEEQHDQVSQFCYCSGHIWRISWMYSQFSEYVIQTYTALRDQMLYTCTGNNNIINIGFCDIHKLYQCSLF